MELFEIKFSEEDINRLSDEFPPGFTEAALPELASVVKGTAYSISNAWKKYLNKEQGLEGIEFLEKTNKSMITSVKVRKNKDFDYTVYSDSPEMEKATKGTDPVYYDMKKTHPYGKKSRNKGGVPYLIIPFRWGTPNDKGTKRRWNNTIPMAQYNTSIKKFDRSMRTSQQRTEKNYKGEDIARSTYSWGDRLGKLEAWDDRSAGMVRMKDMNKSTYWTFRVISAKSKPGSWLYWRDGRNGVDIIGALRKTFCKNNEENFVNAMENDLASLQ